MNHKLILLASIKYIECKKNINFYFISEHGIQQAYFNEAQRHLNGPLQTELLFIILLALIKYSHAKKY